jgi:hypothetical protein
MKSGFITSEFILTLVLLLLAAGAFFLGKIAWTDVVAFAAVALAVSGYSIGRGIAKAGAPVGGSVLGDSAEALAKKEVKP